ncbi:valine--tRNA ligase [Patescibacteria group bacterium]|nr:valine--tRNA ligase [Patescibacteria group bacterium]
MKEIEKAYEAKMYEDSIYKMWEESGIFSPKVDPNKKPFTISMPPPNATGVLHLGHSSMLALEDAMIRYKRMQGFSALWLPGTDHAGIATQNRVEKNLLAKGITRQDLGREKFLEEVDKFVEKSRGTIRSQIRKMGASCDWSRERYTLDEGLSRAVREVFSRMYHDELIYRGSRIVNWCPRCGSTLADDEVEYQEQNAKLYHIKYQVKDSDKFVVVATVRPETMLGDSAVAVNPSDDRYKDLIGKILILPLQGREIPIIADEHVDLEFGTGALKLTPAHSIVDWEIGKKHGLKEFQVIDEEGKMTKSAGEKYAGLFAKEAQKQIIEDLIEQDLLVKTEELANKLSVCYRCKTAIEPLISKQWFVSVDKPIIQDGDKKKSLKEKAIEVVRNKEIEIIPEHFDKTYFNWMENLHDWCISRQLWFGHQIPVWYCDDCSEVIVQADEPSKCTKCGSEKLTRDPDVLDTWFSSGLWTFSTLGWPERTTDLEYFHPTSVLETGYDIIFFWVARMILMTTYALNTIPFEKVYLHGLIRTREGKKMSKSNPESCIDPLDMIDKYGTDALRLSFLIGSTPGNDMRLYEEKIAGYRNFVNKIWNASRFALMNIDNEAFESPFTTDDIISRADKWILTKLQYLIKDVTEDMENFRFSDAGTKIYNFTWCEYCDWYLEISKGKHLNPKVLLHVLEDVLKLIHPFIPFVTEVLWGNLNKDKMLIAESWPVFSKDLLFVEEVEEMEILHQIISDIRSVRSEYGVEPGKKIHATIYSGKYKNFLEEKKEPLMRMARIENLTILESGDKIDHAVCVFVGNVEVYLPLQELVDVEKERARLQKELDNIKPFAKSLESKLKNQSFVSNAPEAVIEKEKKRLFEVQQQIEKFEKQLNEL